MLINKKKLLSILIVAFVLYQSIPAVYAESGYTIPGKETPESTNTTDTTQTPPPTETTAPSETTQPGGGGGYVIPGSTAKPVPIPSNVPQPSQTPESLSAQDYLSAITLAFVDGIDEITPDNPNAEFRVASVRVPNERTASAQWYINGEAREDYSSDDFVIYNGKMTCFEYSVPFSKETPDGEITIAFELRLGGAIRRVEKHVKITNHPEEHYNSQEIIRVFENIKPVEIEATVKNRTYTYSDGRLSSSNGSLNSGDLVYYMDHSGTYAAKIWIPEESRICWVPYYSISISNKNYTIEEDFSDSDKEIFVNAKEYKSNSDYLIWINLQRQRVNVFEGSEGNWKLIRVSTCSSGKNTTPTPTGVMTYCGYSNGWFHDTYYVKPVMYLNLERGIALHSILFNPNGTVQDGTQGRPVSHGCVRMPLDEIQWLAEYIPIGTTVVVF